MTHAQGAGSDPAGYRRSIRSHPGRRIFRPGRSECLHIFCTGAVSHLDTWDYKPELWKRNGQPMPGVEKLITFQGENGNLAQSPWKFKPRGQTASTFPTCCLTWPNVPTNCASFTR